MDPKRKWSNPTTVSIIPASTVAFLKYSPDTLIDRRSVSRLPILIDTVDFVFKVQCTRVGQGCPVVLLGVARLLNFLDRETLSLHYLMNMFGAPIALEPDTSIHC